MEESNKIILNQDLKILFRYVSKSLLTIFLTVVGFAFVKTSNEIRAIQIEECGEFLPFSPPIAGKNITKRCNTTWLTAITQCDKEYELEFLSDCCLFGRALAFLFGYKSDQGSPKGIMFRCFVLKTLSTLIFYTFSYIPPGTVYLHDLISGYCEGTILCSAQTLIGHWTATHLTLFSTLIQSVHYLGRVAITPMVVKTIINTTFAQRVTHVQIYICIFLTCFCFVWNVVIFDTPRNHGFIMDHERKHILRKSNCAQAQVFKIPWRQIWSNKYFATYLAVRSIALFQYIFLIRAVGSIICTDTGGSGYDNEYSHHCIAALCGANISSFVADFLTHSGFFTKAGARKTFFFLFILGNVSYYYFYLDAIEFRKNLLYTRSDFILVTTSMLNSFYFSGIACQHFDLSPTFASAQASIVFLAGEIITFIDMRVYANTMDSVDFMVSKYLLLYWLVIVVVMVPTMMVNTCFNNFSIQDYNRCTRHVCKREADIYPINLINFR